jgi:homogentisate 1,2-dioxygenase
MYQAKGQYSQQAHVNLPHQTYEEEFGKQGFYGPVSHLYHLNAPTSWSHIEGPLRPQAFHTLKSELSENTAFSDRTILLYNIQVSLGIEKPKAMASTLFRRNADGDELIFVHRGAGQLNSDFGELAFETGDYLVIPKGTTYQFMHQQPDPVFLVIESPTPFTQPERGLLGQHALYDPGVLAFPEAKAHSEKGVFQVQIKRQNQLTTVTYPFHPLDVVGWKGTLSVFKLNVRDICPVGSHRAHLPPSVHSTFQASGFVVCTFVPRPLEQTAEAVRVPFYHRNIDYDEVLFYHDGDFFSREGIHPGMITLHPQGIHHGPHPKAIEAAREKLFTQEIAVMLDSEMPLHVSDAAKSCEIEEYWQSWQTDHVPDMSAMNTSVGKES